MNATFLVANLWTKNAACVKNVSKSLFEFKNPLVAASTKVEKRRIERLDERAVHQYMDVGEEFFAFRVLKELFVGVARIAPDVHSRALADGF